MDPQRNSGNKLIKNTGIKGGGQLKLTFFFLVLGEVFDRADVAGITNECIKSYHVGKLTNKVNDEKN